MKVLTRRAAILGVGAAAGWALAGRLGPDLPQYAGTTTLPSPQAAGLTADTLMNDASGLSPTRVHKHLIVKDDPFDSLVSRLRAELVEAKAAGRALNVGAARHSMGGQAIPRDGTAITFEANWLEADTAAGTYRAHAGARWSQVIAALDPMGFSPKVMQSNHDFGLAATFSVNAHGWPVPFGPMGSTVRSLRMLLPSGDLVTCSATENADLFGLAMGGYGLIGIILDLEIEMVANRLLVPTVTRMPAADFAKAFDAAIKDPAISMAYGRLNVERATFFTDSLLITYRDALEQGVLPAASGSGWMSHAASRIYRAQLGNEAMKSVRWWNETVVGPALGGGEVTRNSLINEPVSTLDDRNPDRTDILHEYFIAFDQFDAFLTICREVIPASYQEFLNVTLRFVGQDDQAVLSYAAVPRIAAVMSFSQEMTTRAEADMARMTQDLIDRITAIGGAYYLPYRPHARLDQLAAAYPRASEFAAAKRAVDPGLVLRNNLWDSYLGRI